MFLGIEEIWNLRVKTDLKCTECANGRVLVNVNKIKNQYMQNKKIISFMMAAVIVGGFAFAAPIFAQGNSGFNRGMMGKPGIVGMVSAVSGTTITVTSKNKMKSEGSAGTQTTTIYTVDASKATVAKNGATSAISAIAVGDTIMVQGTITGTNIVATAIRDGVRPGLEKQDLSQIQGNGQPIVAGKVTALSGSSITITNASNVTYTIDATNAKFAVNGVVNPTISNVAVGDSVVVQGIINGNAVTASSVIDQKAKPAGTGDNAENKTKPQGGFGGMMHGIGSFFKHLFGF